MQGFRSSINLQFDWPNPSLVERYVLTSSHCEVLNGVLEGVTRQEAKRAYLLVGPYGTGKSLLSTIICQLLSKKFSEEWRAQLLSQAERMDTMLASQLRQVEHVGRTYVPVMINGLTGSFRTIINQAVYRALRHEGIGITTPNEADAILNTVDRWKQFYPDTYGAFLDYLNVRHVHESDWRDGIIHCHEEPTRDFISFYPRATSGSPWTFEQEIYFVENLEVLSAELAARKIGLMIVYDEFGRFLQSLSGEDTLRNMQDLQDLAEFVDRAPNIHLLVVGHKHIRQYAASSRESIRMEFEKVEKRFRFYSLENDSGTFLRLAQEAIAETNRLMLSGVVELESLNLESAEKLQQYPLFSEFTSYQLDQGIIKALYPLHPVAVMLLPQLSNIFGQNERTLFSFLSDNERYSLRDHVDQHDGYYYADQLFAFFDVGLAETKEQASLQLYHTIAPFLDSQMPLQRRIVELLTMWSVTRLTQKQSATTSFLAFAIGIGLEEAEAVLSQLSAAKLVRYNAIREHWELYDGSSIDLNAVIAEKLSFIPLHEQECKILLERHLPYTYILPYEYNDEMDMLRYADIKFACVDEIKPFREVDFPADDRIWLIVYENEDQFDDPAAVMQEADAPYLAAFPHFTIESVRPSLLQYKVVDQLLHDLEFLAHDARLKNELSYLLQETSMRIKEFVSRYFSFQGMEWWSGTERRSIKDMQGLEQLVTIRLRNRYRDSPIIRNEAFNRNRISNVQRRALIDVIDRLIRQPAEPNLGITGYGPNYLIYATALKNNNYCFDELAGIRCDGTLAAIREALREELERRPVGKLSDLTDMLAAPPYGIRSSVIPLLFVALLRDRWDQLLFYSHDMLLTHLNGAAVLELVEMAESYEYRSYNWTAEEKNQLQALGHLFGLSTETSVSFLHTAEALLNWLRRLPKFIQTTVQLSPAAVRVRDIIRSAEVDPYSNMKQLVACGDEQDLAGVKNELERFLDLNEAELEQSVLKMTGQGSFAKLYMTLNQYRDKAISRNSKLLTWTRDDEPAGVIDRLAEHLVGVPRTEWSDATQELFLSQIKYEWELLHIGMETAALSGAELELNVPLSKKSQTLYANVKNMIKYAGRDISPQEVKQLLVKLLLELQ